jgi:prepilin-type N-terminal cleavage/methylation domain-containing protein
MANRLARRTISGERRLPACSRRQPAFDTARGGNPKGIVEAAGRRVCAAGSRARQAGSLRSPDARSPASGGFTLIEVLIVITIILVLAGLILATSSYVQTKGKRSRAEAEIAAISAALENYKADNGIYPRDATSDALDPRVHLNPDPQVGDSEYRAASTFLFTQLSGLNPDQTAIAGAKNYFTFKPQFLGGTTNGSGTVLYLKDPFGNSYGYSTIYQTNSTKGYNPTFDLWSTGGLASSANPTPTPNPLPTPQALWIKNW